MNVIVETVVTVILIPNILVSLAHPNLRVFITHGGQLSTTEAIHFGVPIVGIPVYGDQFVNMRLAIRKGFGVTVALKENLAELLKPALLEVITNPR